MQTLNLLKRNDDFIRMSKPQFAANKLIHQIRVGFLRVQQADAICDFRLFLFEQCQFGMTHFVNPKTLDGDVVPHPLATDTATAAVVEVA